MDRDTSGLWDQVKGDLHRRMEGQMGNGRALRYVSRVYLHLAQRDPQALQRILTSLALEDQGFRE